MIIDETYIDALIRKSVTEKLSEQEMCELEEWICKSSENRKYYIHCKAIYTLQELEKPHARISDFKRTIAPKLRNRRRHIISGAAAAVLVFLIAGVWVIFDKKEEQIALTPTMESPEYGVTIFKQNEELNLAKIGKNEPLSFDSDKKVLSLSKSGKSEMITVVIAKGNRYQLILPDSSTVWLNSDSKLMFDSNFTTRDVQLTGEGYFEVKRDSLAPFTVTLDKGRAITVLGTTFNVKSYREDSLAKISLLQGSIRVNAASESIILSPSKEVLIDNEDKMIVQTISSGGAFAWIDGSVIYKNEPFEFILNDLGRRYNVEFEIKDTVLRQELFTMNIDKCELEKVLKYLKKAGRGLFDLKWVDGKIIIYAN